MKFVSIDLDHNQLPKLATVTLTRREMQLIAGITGNMSKDDIERLCPGYSEDSYELYNGLVGSLFNRYWDDGLKEAIADVRQFEY